MNVASTVCFTAGRTGIKLRTIHCLTVCFCSHTFHPKPNKHMTLLTTNNTKIEKSIPYGYLTAGLHLAPAKLSGYEVCRNRSKGCTFSCLNTAGLGVMTAVQLARIAKTKFYFEERAVFMDQLVKELNAFVRKAARKNLKPAVRLNLTSDLDWEDSGIMELFPGSSSTTTRRSAQGWSSSWKATFLPTTI